MKEAAMSKIKWKEILTDAAYLLFGGILYGAAYNMFLIPGNVYVGGASGIATALYNAGLVHLPIGTMIIIINIPLMVLFTYFYTHKNANWENRNQSNDTQFQAPV